MGNLRAIHWLAVVIAALAVAVILTERPIDITAGPVATPIATAADAPKWAKHAVTSTNSLYPNTPGAVVVIGNGLAVPAATWSMSTTTPTTWSSSSGNSATFTTAPR